MTELQARTWLRCLLSMGHPEATHALRVWHLDRRAAVDLVACLVAPLSKEDV